MVKKTEEDWKNLKGPKMCHEKYLNFKNYMIAASDSEIEFSNFSIYTSHSLHCRAKFGMNDNDIKYIEKFMCSICKNWLMLKVVKK